MTMHVTEDGAISKGPDAEIGNTPGADDEPTDPLLAPAAGLKGVGPRLAGLLDRLCGPGNDGRARRLDLLWHLPHGAIDHTLADPTAVLQDGVRATLLVEVRAHDPPRQGRRRPYRITCTGPSDGLQLVFFHGRRAYLEQQLPPGARRIVGGVVRRFGGCWQMVHPDLIVPPEAFGAGRWVQPIYGTTEGLPQRTLARIIQTALEELDEPPEWQDPSWLQRQGWPSFSGALDRLHRPTEIGDIAPSGRPRARLAFDELLAGQLALAATRAHQPTAAGRSLQTPGALRRRVRAALPFALTAAQDRVLGEIDCDLAAPSPMLRLLQGDVGSGKTLVATLAMLTAVEAGLQAALMAPTELLARQHARSIGHLLAPTGIAVGLLTGREGGAERRTLRHRLACGAVKIVVGTHALFQEAVAFADLGLAVIDEQHRFGVHQRLRLAAKGAAADVLVMTATPIPRSLVLALYGDIALSELREKPAGRRPIETRVISLARLAEVTAAIERLLRAGQQLYWVCPLVAPSEDGDLAAAEARYEMLRARFGATVGLVHGRLPAAAKATTMAAFARGALRLLVATTVIEVGVDVAGATAMVIEHAERFGLAQLHQLRGRVGRSDRPSSCLLLYAEPLSEPARARLEVLRATEDGFRIAEEDLRLRGPGELLGTRQSGLPPLRLADLSVHGDLVAAARDDARLILHRDPGLCSLRGQALRRLLRLFDRQAACAYLRSG